MEERLKTIVFQQLLVIRRVEIHPIRRFVKTLHETSPPFVPLTEIDRPIHGFHPLLGKPVPGHVQQHVGSLLAVDTIEKADAPYRNIVPFVLVTLVYKSRYPADELAILIL